MSRSSDKNPPEATPHGSTARDPVRWVSWLVAALAAVWLVTALTVNYSAKPAANGFNYDAFGQLPVSYGGRFKPMDTVARNTLTILSGRQKLKLDDDTELTATQWLTDVLAVPGTAATYPIFRVDHPEVRTLIGQGESDAKRFSYSDIDPQLQNLFQVARQADAIDRASRDAFQNQVLELAGHISTFLGLANHEAIHTIPTDDADAGDWQPMHADGPASLTDDTMANNTRRLYHEVYNAYSAGQPVQFNQKVQQLQHQLASADATIADKAGLEWHFNHFGPFGKTMVLYLVAGLLIVFSWLVAPRLLLSTAMKLVVVALVLHTAALLVRILLSGRPPVTNLYSSAVFIGWGIVILSLVLEPLIKRGLGLIVGVGAGFATLLIAQGLSSDGDTMAVLQAVLDTNFWLWTHVTTITLGYTAAYVAGALGIVYVLAGVFTKAVDRQLSRRLSAAIYGTVCFAVLLSFIGTILGGIWADQSWGRFWGWDPKENGALMIVIWNAVILHCRWGHMVRERGMAVLAILGNIVTSWSWFGVNLLGAGLHSYGFTDGGDGNMLQKLLNPGPKEWLLLFVFSQLLLVVVGTLPMSAWRSFRRPTAKQQNADAQGKAPKGKTQPA